MESGVPPAASPNAMPPLAVRAFTATTASGHGRTALAGALRDGRSGLRPNDFGDAALDTWIGRVEGLDDLPLPPALGDWECRNNRLAWLALQHDGVLEAVSAMRAKHGAERVAIVIGTSTSSIGATEEAYAGLVDGAFPPALSRPRVHTPHSLGGFIQAATGLRGPCVTVATACSSSAKVFAQAARLIQAGLADAALVGGVDTLCGSVLFGFNSLGLVSAEPCRPFDVARNGLSLGEAGGFAVLERGSDADLLLRGYGESSDAHHMSAPHPQGLGARLAMADALARAGIDADAIGYLNLHGTATPANDAIEAGAVAALFPAGLHASSTKGWTGHTLGAAGIVESVIALLALSDGWLPGTLNSVQTGPRLRAADPLAGRSAQDCPRDEQFLRLRWQQLLAGVWGAGMSVLTAHVAGIGFWTRGLPSWPAACAYVRDGTHDETAPAKPAPRLLAANERRRAPETVAVALDVALAACEDAGVDPATLPSVFTSMHGDLAITDYMCATLADDPRALSPTRFHNSVHNAAAGYWTIGTGCNLPRHCAEQWRCEFRAGPAGGLDPAGQRRRRGAAGGL